jgi:hypothetical protein
MVMIEGRGMVSPSPVHISVGRAEQRYVYSVIQERSRRRSYAMRADKWGRGLTAGKDIACLGWVSKGDLAGLTGLVGEYATFLYLSKEFGTRNVIWNPGPTQLGDGGRDLDVFGQRIQVKTRRASYGKTLVRRISHKGGRIEPLDFDILVSCEWFLGKNVSLMGWCKRGKLFDSNFARSRFDHYNLEVFDRSLLPMGRLLDHLAVRRAVSA